MPPASDAQSHARIRVRRQPDLARYDHADIAAVLAAGLVVHVAVVDPDVGPLVVPMAYGLTPDAIVLHGSTGSRLMRLLHAGTDVCLNVCLLDGLVLARSAFETSMRYRSVTVFGRSVGIDADDLAAKRDLVHGVLERTVPGHLDGLRPTTDAELRRTHVVVVALDEASAKVAAGGPDDPPEDAALPIWAGAVRFRTVVDGVETAPDAATAGLAPSISVTSFVADHGDDVTGVRRRPDRPA